MKGLSILVKYFVLLAALNLIWIQMPTGVAQAGIIGTETTMSFADSKDRSTARAFFDREEVQAALVAQGINPMEAKARIQYLTDEEVQRLNGLMDQLPAGGLDIVGLAVFVLIVLLITDILGITDIFSFIKPIR